MKGNVPSVSSLTATYKGGPSFSQSCLLSIHPHCFLTFKQNPNVTYRSHLLFHTEAQMPQEANQILNSRQSWQWQSPCKQLVAPIGPQPTCACITLQLRTNLISVMSPLLFKGRREDGLAVKFGLSHKPQSSFLSLPSVGVTIMCHGGKISQ